MNSPLAMRLEAFGPLPEADVELLNGLSSRGRLYPAGADIIAEDDVPDNVHLVTRGFACRQKLLENGKRQIVAYLLPGDFCDLHVFILDAMDHSISTLSECDIVHIPRQTILRMLDRPLLARALWLSTLVDEATLREWIVNLGQRSAHDRLAHFFCELYLRMEIIGAVDRNTCRLPVNQTHLADTLGLSLVHMNRSLKVLKDEGAATHQSGLLKITNIDLLKQIAGYKSNYLHLDAAAKAPVAAF